MGFLRRTPPVPRMGIPIDRDEYLREVASNARPGMSYDGRYWVALIEVEDSKNRIDRLIWEHAATYHEVKSYLKDFERDYRRKPTRVSSVRIDDVTGAWSIKPRGGPEAILFVLHPVALRYPAYGPRQEE